MGRLTTLDLTGNIFRADGIEHLAKPIGTLANLTSLRLASNDIGPLGVQSLANAIGKLEQLVDLDLSYNGLGPDGAQHLASPLQKFGECRKLAVLNLRGNGIGTDGINHLALPLGQLESLKECHLGGNDIGPDGAKLLAAPLKKLAEGAKLQKLSLEANGIGPRGIEYLAAPLGMMAQLTSLFLGANLLGVDGARLLASLLGELARSERLSALGLDESGLSMAGATHIANSLETLRCLVYLDLSWNVLGWKGARALADALAKLVNLEHLKIQSNGLGSDGARHLARPLGKLVKLTHLELGINAFGPEGAQHLAGSLGKLDKLTHLNLSGNDLGPVGAKHLAGPLGKLDKLTDLKLFGNDLGPVGMQYLAKTLCQMHARVDLQNNGINIPFAVLDTRDARAISRWWIESTQGRPLREAKAMLLGRGQVGKSHVAARLARKFADYNRPVSTNEAQIESTFAWHSHRLRIPDCAPQTKNADPSSRSVTDVERDATVHLFDFAGQPSAWQAHSMFFDVSRNVYIVVCNATETADKNRLDYYLRLARVEGQGMPIVVVLTHCKSKSRELTRAIVEKVAREDVGLVLANPRGKAVQIAPGPRAPEPSANLRRSFTERLDEERHPGRSRERLADESRVLSPALDSAKTDSPWQGVPSAPVWIVDGYDSAFDDDDEAGAPALYEALRWAISQLTAMWEQRFSLTFEEVRNAIINTPTEPEAAFGAWKCMQIGEFETLVDRTARQFDLEPDPGRAPQYLDVLQSLGTVFWLGKRARRASKLSETILNPEWAREPVYRVLRVHASPALNPHQDPGLLSTLEIKALLEGDTPHPDGSQRIADTELLLEFMRECKLVHEAGEQCDIWVVPDRLIDDRDLQGARSEAPFKDWHARRWGFPVYLPDDVFLKIMGFCAPHLQTARGYLNRNFFLVKKTDQTWSHIVVTDRNARTVSVWAPADYIESATAAVETLLERFRPSQWPVTTPIHDGPRFELRTKELWELWEAVRGKLDLSRDKWLALESALNEIDRSSKGNPRTKRQVAAVEIVYRMDTSPDGEPDSRKSKCDSAAALFRSLIERDAQGLSRFCVPEACGKMLFDALSPQSASKQEAQARLRQLCKPEATSGGGAAELAKQQASERLRRSYKSVHGVDSKAPRGGRSASIDTVYDDGLRIRSRRSRADDADES